jgi:membrane glycosyltransferase
LYNPDLILCATLAAAAAPKGIGPYIRQHFLDTTFRGLYQANGFDLALLIPYVIVLCLLAGYGMHRYVLVYLYYKHRKNLTVDPAARFAELPRVTVQLPIFNEQYVVERLLEAICKLDYPREKLDIQVLDDSTDETVEVARGLVERYAALGNPITYHHRTNREGYKAGALAEGMNTSKGEFIAIFDADFMPPEDFLLLTIHHFTDPKIGMVQTRWTHLNRHYSFLTEVEAILLDGHSPTSTPPPGCGDAPRSKRPAAGSTLRLPKIPIFPIAPSSRDGNLFTCRMWSARRNCRWR